KGAGTGVVVRVVRTNSRPKHRETGPEPPTILHLVLISLLPSLPNKPFPGASLLVAAAAILSPIHPRIVCCIAPCHQQSPFGPNQWSPSSTAPIHAGRHRFALAFTYPSEHYSLQPRPVCSSPHPFTDVVWRLLIL